MVADPQRQALRVCGLGYIASIEGVRSNWHGQGPGALPVRSNTNLCIGRAYLTTWGNYFAGKIDETRISS
jgi:hypothetical protein